MTKHIISWKKRLALYFENRAQKEIKIEIETAKESIIHLLTSSFSTEQSIEIFNSISYEFNNKMQSRLDRISEEKAVIEKFLS